MKRKTKNTAHLIGAFPITTAGFIKKDAKLLIKKKKYLYLSIALPLILGIIYVLMLGGSSANIDVMVCDYDNTELTNNAFKNLEGFTIDYRTEDCTDSMKEAIKDRKFLFGVQINEGFSKDLENLQQSNIIVFFDNSDPGITSLAEWKFDQAIEPFEKELSKQFSKELSGSAKSAREKLTLGLDLADNFNIRYSGLTDNLEEAEAELLLLEELDPEFVSEPIIVDKTGVYDSERDVMELGLPPLFAVLNLFLILMLVSTGIIYDRRNKLLARIRASVSTPLSYVLGKLVVFLLITVIQFVILYIIFMAFGANFDVDYGLLLQALIITSLINTLVGVIIGFISDSEGVAVLISLILTLPLLFLSGMFYPLELMPKIVQFFSNLMPLKTEVLLMKKALLFGGTISSGDYLIPLGLLIVILIVFRKVR